jgi:membrane-associated phospholipid phosphatase
LSASDVQRTANFLADHALALLGLGLLSVVGAYGVVILIVIGLVRLQPLIVRMFSPLLQRAGRSHGALMAATAIVASVLWWYRGALLAAAWIATQVGGAVLNVVLKETFERTRPEMAGQLLASSSWSFPSGHAMGTFVFCGVAAFLVLRRRRSRWVTGVIVTASLMWCLVMSFSRLYLGVHYVSNVSAGLVGGAAWVPNAMVLVNPLGLTITYVRVDQALR